MEKSNDNGCGCTEGRRRRRFLRLALLLSGLSLAFYMPFKAATQFSSIQEIYGPWFLQGAVVAVAALLFAIRPSFGARLPLIPRIGVGTAALLWMATGLACTPHLLETVKTSLGPGLFAWFHMTVQHIFLSVGVAAFAIAPQWSARLLGAATTAAKMATEAIPESAT